MDAPLVLTREQSRRVDELAIREYGFTGLVLMENAGRGAVDVLLGVDPTLANDGSLVAILCGRGNNAGDGFVIARHLAIHGVAARVVLLCPPAELTGDARANYDILVKSRAPLADLSAAAQRGDAALCQALDRTAGDAAWLADAMLGTGAVGEPREPFRMAIEWINRRAGRRFAVDLPSGLDCDTGAAAMATVRADVTCTFAAAKPGLLEVAAAKYVGELHVASIGVPPAVLRQAARG
jgi:NAD(P)H-hydrate epimerase